MAAIRDKWKLAAVSGETQNITRNSQLQDTFIPAMTEEYITQVSGEIEGRGTKKLSREFSRKQ